MRGYSARFRVGRGVYWEWSDGDYVREQGSQCIRALEFICLIAAAAATREIVRVLDGDEYAWHDLETFGLIGIFSWPSRCRGGGSVYGSFRRFHGYSSR